MAGDRRDHCCQLARSGKGDLLTWDGARGSCVRRTERLADPPAGAGGDRLHLASLAGHGCLREGCWLHVTVSKHISLARVKHEMVWYIRLFLILLTQQCDLPCDPVTRGSLRG